MAVALFARLLAHIMFSGFRAQQTFRDAMLSRTCCAMSAMPPDVSNLRLLSALINGVTAHPLHFLLLPCVRGLRRTHRLAVVAGAVFALVSIVLLMYGSLSSRWEQMLVYVERWFLVGSPLVMSIAVILLALLRLLDVQYVSTVLDATPVGVLFIFIVMMYVAFWFFEYWANRWVGEELLEMLGAEQIRLPGLRAVLVPVRARDRALGQRRRPRHRAAWHGPIRGAGLVRARTSPGPASARRSTPSPPMGWWRSSTCSGQHHDQWRGLLRTTSGAA